MIKIMTILAFILWLVTALFALGVFTYSKDKQPKNKVHFYVARNKNNKLALWFGKPFRGINSWINMDNSVILTNGKLNLYGLDVEDYNNLKWEDEPVEVLLNLDD